MKRVFITSLLTMAFLFLLGAGQDAVRQSVRGQTGKGTAGKEQMASATTPESNYTIAPLRRDFKNSFPIPAGEKLEYEIKLSRFPIYASVGVVTLENLGEIAVQQKLVDQTALEKKAEPLIDGLNIEFTPAPDEQILRLRGIAVSKGALLGIFGVDVRDRFEALVDLRDFSARVSLKEVKEGKKHSVQSAVFDPAEEQNYQFDVLVSKRESLKTDCGKVKTVRLEPKLFGPGRLISRQGEMTMWVSDDSKHTPLRLLAKTSAFTVTAKLLNFKKKCHIIEQGDEKGETRGNSGTGGKVE